MFLNYLKRFCKNDFRVFGMVNLPKSDFGHQAKLISIILINEIFFKRIHKKEIRKSCNWNYLVLSFQIKLSITLELFHLSQEI
jgi:hypothetical protein